MVQPRQDHLTQLILLASSRRIVGDGRHHFGPRRDIALDLRAPGHTQGRQRLISGLITFLIFAGFLELRIVPLLTAILVGFVYGGSLVIAILPRASSEVSWDGHLFDAIAGGLAAYALFGRSRSE